MTEDQAMDEYRRTSVDEEEGEVIDEAPIKTKKKNQNTIMGDGQYQN